VSDSGSGTDVPVELLFLGGGRMGGALIGGLLGQGHPVESIAVVERETDRRAELTSTFPGLRVESTPVPARTVVVCTKPGDVLAALGEAATVGLERVVSIAAGVSTAAIEAVVGSVPVVRAMPNTPALLGEAATAVAAGSQAGPADLERAEALLTGVGTVVRVDESAMDAVTAVSGSGPAYVYLLAEHLAAAGEALGLPDELADALVRQTILGAARMLVETGDAAASLRAAVTSPGGTTAAAVAAFEDAEFDVMVRRAVEAAARRSAELGAEFGGDVAAGPMPDGR
jgi:pyrroline-5-carboxylate reductase